MFASQANFRVGETVEFSYNGKAREGVVEKVNENTVCLKMKEGGYKQFSYGKIVPPMHINS